MESRVIWKNMEYLLWIHWFRKYSICVLSVDKVTDNLEIIFKHGKFLRMLHEQTNKETNKLPTSSLWISRK